jgi:hypothetical protein
LAADAGDIAVEAGREGRAIRREVGAGTGLLGFVSEVSLNWGGGELTAHAGRSGGRSPGFWAEVRAARAVRRKVVVSFMLRC